MLESDAINYLVNDLVTGVCEFKRDSLNRGVNDEHINIRIDHIPARKNLNDTNYFLLNALKNSKKAVLITMHNANFSKEIHFIAESKSAIKATIALRGFQ
ncbi:hypothetical protein BTN98_18550 [Photobacterium aquimaris]|uniref:Uncharacterized protein n=2 Tax=Photobacterium aquimaris TaxID=512643 RepID=A0A2T3HWQ0_9GAMM|nr:hypothetical protein AYY21_15920 [Photobacterium aquimaris]PQJ37142.1 hypothetical protein BTN98_18550 [Photobacterium aquimaris]PSU03449.1 hypothetical protein C0W81_11825 [Photobacterium aquimaris]